MNTRSIIIFYGLFFLIIGCEEPTELDTTPPTVTITSPQSGSTVSEIVTITCVSTDNKGIEKVELWVDGVSTGVIDETEPYSLGWNTTIHEDGSSYAITVRSFDVTGNKVDSDPINLFVDNSTSFPNVGNIESIHYNHTEMIVLWSKSIDNDFDNYKLLKSGSEDGDKSIIITLTGISDN